MFYEIKLENFPIVTQYYTVTRNTVWQITDKDNILIIIENGECIISCNGETHTLKKGDVFLVPANQSYKRQPIGDSFCTMRYIHFSHSEKFLEKDVEEINNNLRLIKENMDYEILSGEINTSYFHTIYLKNHTTIDNFSKFLKLTKEIRLYSNKKQLLCNLQSSITLCNILLSLSFYVTESFSSDFQPAKSTAVPPNLRRAIEYITEHYSEQIKLDELANHCNVSKQQLIRYFKSSMNTTPINYITEYKLARAKELLFNQPQLSVKEIAAELGFDNQRYFSRVFVSHNNETPTNYRKRTIEYHNKNKD